MVAEGDVFHRPVVTGLQKPEVGLDHLLALAAELVPDLLPDLLHVPVVKSAEHADRPDILAAARIGDELPALLVHRILVDDVAALPEILHRFGVAIAHRLILVLGPHVLEEDDSALAQRTDVDAAV